MCTSLRRPTVSNADADIDPNAIGDTYPNADCDPNVYARTNTHSHPDAYSYSNSERDPNAYSNSNGYAHAM